MQKFVNVSEVKKKNTTLHNQKKNYALPQFKSFKALISLTTWSMEFPNLINFFSFTFQSKEMKVWIS